MRPSQQLGCLFLTSLIGLFSFDMKEVAAQAKKAAAVAPSPQSPLISGLSLAGGRRGAPLELKLTGTNLSNPVGVWSDLQIPARFEPDKSNGNGVNSLRVFLDIPADAPIGFHPFRLVTEQGVSNQRLLAIDDLPEVLESETNHFKKSAQVIPIPCVVSGRIELESSDFFKISVKAGQRLTIEAFGRRLGSPFDPMILLHDASTGRELPGLYSDDAPGLQSDARLTHTFKDGGDYLIELRDSVHRGGADYEYRLRLGDFPAAIAPIPVALKRGTTAKVHFAGPAVEGVRPVEVRAPAESAKSAFYVSPRFADGLPAWPLPVLLSDYEEIAETEPNNDAASANRLPVPGGVTGSFQQKGDVDFYSFPAKKGAKYIINAATYEINSPAEVYLILKNEKNAELAKSVPTAPAARIEYTAAEDGILLIHAEHLNYAHGPNEIYHLTVQTAEPEVDVSIGIDRFEVVPGGVTLIPLVTAVRRNFTGPIELSVESTPGLSGNCIIASGAPAQNAAGQVFAYLPLHAASDLKTGAYAFRIRTRLNSSDKPYFGLANATELVKQSMAGLAFPPPELLHSFNVAVIGNPLFRVALKGESPHLTRGTTATFPLAAVRTQGFIDEISLAAVNLPGSVTVRTKPIAKGASESQLEVTVSKDAGPGPSAFYLRCSAKAGNKEFAYFAQPIAFVIDPEMKKDESPLEKKKEGDESKKEEKSEK